MKFPTSVHAEGWYDKFDAAAPSARPVGTAVAASAALAKPVRKGAPRRFPRVTAHTRWHDGATPPVVTAPWVEPVRAPVATGRRASATLMLGVGVGAALLAGGAAVLLRGAHDGAPSQTLAAATGAVTPDTPSLALSKPELPPATLPATAADLPPPAVPETPVKSQPMPTPTLTPTPTLEAKAPAKVEAVAPALPAAVSAAPASPKLAILAEPAAAPKRLMQSELGVARLEPAQALPSPEAMPLESARPTAVAVTEARVPAAAPVAVAVPVADDVGINANVKAALAADPMLGPAVSVARITVSTDRGIVKLEGQAPDVASRDRATVLASAATGVRGVDNRLALPTVVGLLQPGAASGQ